MLVQLQEKGLSKLDVHVIDLIEGSDDVLQETKLSSSTRRRLLLGTILREPTASSSVFSGKYVIGLTGGIASGKTHIANYLSKHDCQVFST